MSYSISTLPKRNLHDVFGAITPRTEEAASEEIFTDDCVFQELKGVYHGREEIDWVAGQN